MAGPWDDGAPPWVDSSQNKKTVADDLPPWMDASSVRKGPVQDLPMQPWKASVLPVSTDSEGKVSFDPNAGVLGALKRVLTLPGDVYQGNVQLPSGPPQSSPTGPTTTTPGLFNALGVSTTPVYDDSGPGFDRAMEMASTIAPMGPVQRMRPAVAGDVPVPTQAELRAVTDQQYAGARGTGTSYYHPDIADLADNRRQALESRGLFPENAPQGYGLLNRLATPSPTSTSPAIPIAQVDAIRQGLGNLQAGPDRTAGRVIREGIDDFIANPPPGSVASGDAQAAAEAYRAARGNAAAGYRSEDITNLGVSAADRAEATGSGRNISALIKGRVATMLDPNHPERLAGYNADEVAALRAVLEGGPISRLGRLAGNILGGGGGIGSIMSGAAGAAAGGPIGAVVAPTTGLMLRSATNRATERALNAANETVLQRSPLYQGMLAQAASVPVSPAGLLGSPGMALPRIGLLDYLDQRDRQRQGQ